MLRIAPGTDAYSKQANSPLEAWQLFMTDNMTEQIVINTNSKIIERHTSTNKAVRVD